MSKNGASTNDLVPETGKNEAKKLPQYIAAVAVCMGALATGTVLGWTANVTKELQNGGLNGIEITDLGWVGSLVPLGAMCMCFPIGFMCDKLGRKLALLVFTVPFVAGWLFIIFAQNLAMLCVGRFITGLAGGAFCVAAPLYTSEIAQKEIRGALGSYFQLLLTVGILFSYVVGFVAEVKTYTIVVSVLPVIFAAIFVFQPETPVYRMKQRREAEARAALVRLRGAHYDVDAELKEIKAAIEEEEKNKISLSESLKKRSTKKAAFVCFGLMFFQQASGVNAVIFYTSSIFESAGTGLDEKKATIIVGAIQVIATFVSSMVVDRLGRRILLLLSDFFMAVGLVLLGIFFSLKGVVSDGTLATWSFLPIVGLSVFIVVFSLGYGPIPWMISSELFPPEIKSVASAAAGTFNWFLAFLLTKFYNDLQESIGGDATFYIFTGVCVVGTAFVFFVVPETKGKSMEQIQRELNGDKAEPSGVENKAFES